MKKHLPHVFEVMMMINDDDPDEIETRIRYLVHSIRLHFVFRGPVAISEVENWEKFVRFDMLVSSPSLPRRNLGALGELIAFSRPEVAQLFRGQEGDVYYVTPESIKKISGEFATDQLQALHGEEIEALDNVLFSFADAFISQVIESDCEIAPGDAPGYYSELLTERLRYMALDKVSVDDLREIAFEIRDELNTPYGRNQASGSDPLPF